MKITHLSSRILCLGLIAGMTMSTTACSSGKQEESTDTVSPAAVETARSNQELFVQCYLDLLCKQDFKQYANACGFTVSEVEEDYPDFLDNVIDLFLTYEFSDTERDKFREELKEIFSKCDYTVKEYVENSDGTCTVPVEVKKLVVFKKAIHTANEKYEKWSKKQPEDTDELVLTDKFMDYIIDGCKEALQNPQYKDATIVNITLTPSSSNPNVYDYDPETLGSLQEALVDFSAWDKDVEDEDDDVEASDTTED